MSHIFVNEERNGFDKKKQKKKLCHSNSNMKVGGRVLIGTNQKSQKALNY